MSKLDEEMKVSPKQEKDQAGPSGSDSDTTPEKQTKESHKTDGKPSSVSPSKSESPDKRRKQETPEEERASKHKKEKQEEERLKMQLVVAFDITLREKNHSCSEIEYQVSSSLCYYGLFTCI